MRSDHVESNSGHKHYKHSMATKSQALEKPTSIEINSFVSKFAFDELFPPDLEALLADLHLALEPERQTLLAARLEKQSTYDAGGVPEFKKDSPARKTGWKVAPIPVDLLDRRVEITGPVSNTKMVINMLNPNQNGEKACTAMLDFEDSMSPTWRNAIAGIENVIGVSKLNLTYEQPGENGSATKIYKLDAKNMAHPMVRVRGLHLIEKNVRINGASISAGLFDLATTAFHTAKNFLKAGKTPKFYVPKCEHYLEARWWNQLFRSIEDKLSLPHGTLKVTFLIETLPASFQMEEILFEIRERACGLNGGRWDKIFSDIKTLKMHKDRVLPDRSTIDMTMPWMDNYAKHLIKICHKRGAYAIGGMSAFTPGQSEEIRKIQTEKVIADKCREASIGHDGCWVSHPYFIGLAKSQFKKINQLDVMHADHPAEPDLLPQSIGPKTLDGLRQNIRVGIAYQQGWDQELGCISFENLMEDLATLEISRVQVWQWLYHQVQLDCGTPVNETLVRSLFDEELKRIIEQEKITCPIVTKTYHDAKDKIEKVFLQKDLNHFFTT